MVQPHGRRDRPEPGTSPASDPKGASLGRVCVTTDGNGNAAVEVLENNPVSVNVIADFADFADEGILRTVTVRIAVPASVLRLGRMAEGPAPTAGPRPFSIACR